MGHQFEWYQIVPGINKLQPQVVHAALVAGVLILLAFLFNRRLAARRENPLPSGSFDLVNFFEMLYEAIYGIMKDIMGHHTPHFVYLIGGLATFILFSNLLGLIPGLVPPTDNINTTASCAILIFLATHVYGFRAHGIAYLKHFAGPFWWLAPLMIPIEIISHLARPVSLSLRLFGNLMGDHMVFSLFVGMSVGLTKYVLGGSVLAWPFVLVTPLIPVIFMFLGIFVAIVQTFVFSLLSMMYIAGAIAEEH
jgi:F-type H+-transporting ATPase subunit a